MFEFIPNDLSAEKAFLIIDEFYEGWFSSRKITFDTILKYYPGSDKWDRATLFSGLLWMYYNYPIDFMAARINKIPAARLYRKFNFLRIECFLLNSGMNKSKISKILNNLVDSNLQGDYPAAKSKANMDLDLDLDNIQSFYINSEAEIIKQFPTHPFSKNGKVLPNLIKRIKDDVIFTSKAIDVDNKLIPYLSTEFVTSRRTKKDLKELRKEKKVEQMDQPEKPQLGYAERIQRLLDQVDRQNLVIGKVEEIPKIVEPKLRHKITNKPFKPFIMEEIDLEIDPNVIADKIKEISLKSAYTESDTRRDFSSNSFLKSDNSEGLLAWDPEEIEI